MKKENNLTFVLTYKWFDLIEAGLKGVEYREIKKSTIQKIFDCPKLLKEHGYSIDDIAFFCKKDKILTSSQDFIDEFSKEFDNILLYRGYDKNRASFKHPIKSITIEYPEKHLCEPGAEKTLHFAIRFYDYHPIEECAECGAPILLGGYYHYYDNKYCSDKCLQKEFHESEWDRLCELFPDECYYTENQ